MAEAPGGAGGGRDFRGYGRRRPRAPWAGEARLALCFVVNYEEGAEYSLLDGDERGEAHGLTYAFPPGTRNLRLESDYEYGSRVGVWRLFDLFQEASIPLTVHAAAVAVERNPEVGTAIAELGFEVCAHGWRWEEQWTLEPATEREHIEQAVVSLERTCGTRPAGWYSRYGPSASTRRLLLDVGGFLYDSDAYNDDLPYFVDVEGASHLVLPYSGLYNDTRLLSGALDDPDGLERLLQHAVDQYWSEGETHPRLMTVGLHPRIAGQAARCTALKRFVESCRRRGGIWFARRHDVAAAWHDAFAHADRRETTSRGGAR